MKNLEDLIKEASEINERFEDSKELILAITEVSKLEKLVYKEIIKRYDSVILSVLMLEDFLTELNLCYDEQEITSVLIRAKN